MNILIVGISVIAALVLAGLNLFSNSERTKRQTSIFLVIAILCTAVINIKSIFDSNQLTDKLAKLSDDLADQQKTTTGIADKLTKQTTDVQGLANQLDASLKLAQLQSQMEVENYDQITRVCKQLFYTHLGDLGHALYAVQQDRLDKMFAVQLEEMTTKAERFFRDSLLISRPGDLQAFDKQLTDNANFLLKQIEDFDVCKRQYKAELLATKKNDNYTDDFLKSLDQPIKGKVELEQFVASLALPSRDVPELRSRIATYCEMPYMLRANWADYIGSLKMNSYDYELKQMTDLQKQIEHINPPQANSIPSSPTVNAQKKDDDKPTK